MENNTQRSNSFQKWIWIGVPCGAPHLCANPRVCGMDACMYDVYVGDRWRVVGYASVWFVYIVIRLLHVGECWVDRV